MNPCTGCVGKYSFLNQTVQIKFEAVLVTVAVAEEEDALRDFTNKVHISALNKKTRRNEEACAR